MYKKLSHSVSDCLQQNEKLLGEEDLFCIAFQAKLGRWDSHTPGLYPRPRDFIPGYLRSARGVFQTLLSNNSGPFQHRDAEASEILFSGFSVPLVVISLDFFPDPRDFLTVLHAPLVASSRRSCQTTVVIFNTETQRLQRFSSRGSTYLLWLYPWTSTPTLLSPKVTHRPRTTVTDCRLRSRQLSEEGVVAAPPPDFARGRGASRHKKRSQSQ